jgi:hypothetical protein
MHVVDVQDVEREAAGLRPAVFMWKKPAPVSALPVTTRLAPATFMKVRRSIFSGSFAGSPLSELYLSIDASFLLFASVPISTLQRDDTSAPGASGQGRAVPKGDVSPARLRGQAEMPAQAK